MSGYVLGTAVLSGSPSGESRFWGLREVCRKLNEERSDIPAEDVVQITKALDHEGYGPGDWWVVVYRFPRPAHLKR